MLRKFSKTFELALAASVALALLLTGCGTRPSPVLEVPEGSRAGDLVNRAQCEYQPQGSKTKYSAECGTLIVPENWDKAGSRLIALPVVRIPARGANPAEPLFTLAGGPGAPNLGGTPPDWMLKNHDVVSVGYRGVDGTVRLDCPEVNRLLKLHVGEDLFSQQARGEMGAAVKHCAETYKEAGVDISGYTIPGVVADMEAARIALGYGRIDLFSESYGTRVAQLYAYMHPGSLHRLVLIGVNTPGHFIWRPADLDAMIQRMSMLCAKDAYCSSRTEDLAQTMYSVNHNMPKRWLVFNIDPDTIRMVTHFMFFSTKSMPMVLDAYLAAGRGDPSGLAMMNLAATFMPSGAVIGDQLSKGGTADLDKYLGIKSISLGNSILGAPLSEEVWPLAGAWPVELIPQELRELQQSDVDMLLVNGTVDFSTPPTNLDEAKPYFHKAQAVLLPEFSHVGDVQTLQPKAFERLITSYYDTGVADSSLFVYQPLSFKPGISLTVAARLLVAVVILLPVLIFAGILLVARRIRKRRAMRSV